METKTADRYGASAAVSILFYDNRLRTFIALLALITCAVLIMPAYGNAAGALKEPYRVPRVNGPVKIDAVLDEPMWQQALKITADNEIQPGDNVPAPAPADAYLAYDSEFIYVGFYAHDPDPSQIQAHLKDRDDLNNEDWIMIGFDTFNDQRRLYEFMCNPLGIQQDGIESPDWTDWDAIWYSEGRIVEDGYIVEMAIPFTSIRFQSGDDDQVWGFVVVRKCPRSVEHQITNFELDRDNNCIYCQLDKIVGFAGVSRGRNVEIAPTLSMGGSQTRADETAGPFENNVGNVEPGVTAQWGVTPNYTLSATINPDFSQVEADVMQMDINTRFTLNYPEKRPFFLEGSDFVNPGNGLVNTRNLARPEWGVKLTGKSGPNTIGFFTVRDQSTSLIFPGAEGSDNTALSMQSQGTVLRYRRDIGESSSIGMFTTDREGAFYSNRVAGMDGNIRFTAQDEVQFQAAVTQTAYPGAVADEFDQRKSTFGGSGVDMRYSHSTSSLYYYGKYTVLDPDFRDDMGFVTQVGYKYSEVGGGYTWRREAGSWFNYLEVYGSHDYRLDYDGRPLHRVVSARFNYNGPLRSFYGAYTEYGNNWYDGDRYRANYVSTYAGFRPEPSFSLSFDARYGDDIDYSNHRPGTVLSISPSVEKKFGARFTLYARHNYQRLDVAPGRLFTANQSFVRLTYQFTERMFVRTIVQYSDYRRHIALYEDDDVEATTQRVASQVLFSYTINPQTVFYLGYSDSFQGNEDIDLIQTNRAVFTKLGYAVNM